MTSQNMTIDIFSQMIGKVSLAEVVNRLENWKGSDSFCSVSHFLSFFFVLSAGMQKWIRCDFLSSPTSDHIFKYLKDRFFLELRRVRLVEVNSKNWVCTKAPVERSRLRALRYSALLLLPVLEALTCCTTQIWKVEGPPSSSFVAVSNLVKLADSPSRFCELGNSGSRVILLLMLIAGSPSH